jgi:hypothetical protein
MEKKEDDITSNLMDYCSYWIHESMVIVIFTRLTTERINGGDF